MHARWTHVTACLAAGLFFTYSLVWADTTVESAGTEPATGGSELHRHTWDLALAEGPFSLDADGLVFSFRGDEGDAGQVLVSVAGREHPIQYRLWPDVQAWQVSDEWRERYAREFNGIPGWRDRPVQVAVESQGALRRVWLDGRLLREWQAPDQVPTRPVLTRPDRTTIPVARVWSGRTGPFLDLDLAAYFNDGRTRFQAPNASFTVDGYEVFRHDAGEGCPNIDLAKVRYRDDHLAKGPYQGVSLPYIECDALSSDPQRAIFRVPARFYDRLHLLCRADGDEGEVPRAAVRFVHVPRARFYTREFGLDSEEGVRALESRDIGGERYWHVAVDLNPAAFQEFVTATSNDYLEFELTQPVVMDANSFEHPAGPPSSLHIAAMTLEEAPIAMVVASEATGHLFERREEAVMRVRLESNRDVALDGTVGVSIAMPDGRTEHKGVPFALKPRETTTLDMHVGHASVGKSEFVATLEVKENSGDVRVMTRATSFAILPEFTRTDEDSPFGMWTFFEGHQGASIEATCDILRKAGVRGTLSNFILDTEESAWPENARRTEVLRRYGIEPNWYYLAGIADSGLHGLGDVDARFRWIHAHPQVKYYNLFWETSINPRATQACPPEVRGRAPADLTAEEAQRLHTYMEYGKTWAARARKEAPEIRLSFGNGFPAFTAAMLREGFPHDYIDGLGLDFDMYTSAPEDQPSMWYAPFSGIFYLRELRKLYQCEDKPIWLTEAIYCPTSPIWISERQQADYYVRAHLLAMAMGVERFGMCAEAFDPEGAYHYGHYGPVGLCHAPPELNPRESFCAYAAMTGLLDGLRFDAMLDLGSPHAYGLRFRKEGGRSVHAFWTVNGTRQMTLELEGSEQPTVYNRDGRSITVDTRNSEGNGRRLTLRLDESPIYLAGPPSMKVVDLMPCESTGHSDDGATLVSFETLEGWEIQHEPLEGYEALNLATPLAWAKLDVGTHDGALRVAPPEHLESHPLETLCMSLRRTGAPLVVPGTAAALGVKAHGDRSWGRVVFILEDANGDRWVSAYSQTALDIDGENYVETALPKPPSIAYPGYQGYRPWWRENNDHVPEYPMRLTGLLFELRTHAIHGPELVPLSATGFTLDAIVVR